MTHDRQPSGAVRIAALLSAVVIAALLAWGAGQWMTRGNGPAAGPAQATRPAPLHVATGAPPGGVRLRPDGLGVAAFGAAERVAVDRLRHRLGAPDERGSWRGPTPFGTCPGPVRAARWGRLYVLFTNGPTRYGAGGRWHLFAWQVDAVRRTAVDPGSSGPTPPEPPPLRGYSPRTAAGIGFGSTLAQVRAAYGHRAEVSFGEPGMVHRVRIGFGAAGDLWGALSGGTPLSTVTGLEGGASCGE